MADLTSDENRAVCAIGQEIINAMAGHRVDLAYLACMDALAQAIGGVAHANGNSMAEAILILEELLDTGRERLIETWGQMETISEGAANE